MARKQKVGLENSATRTALLDAAELLMQEEGYAAVTSRKVGARADVRPQLVHYYFKTMDDLFVALLRRRAEEGLAAAKKAMESDQPLRAMWNTSRDPGHVRLNLEMMALANHRKAIRSEIAHFGQQLRDIQQQALARFLKARGIEPRIAPGVVTLLMSSIGVTLVLEETIGMSDAHAETEAFVESVLRRFDAGEIPAEVAPAPPRPVPV